MRFEFDNEGYVCCILYGCTTGSCVEYTGLVPSEPVEYSDMDDWANNAQTQAYYLDDEGNLAYDAERAASLPSDDETPPGGGTLPDGFAETDPTVPMWAKQPTKPKYTAQEVGALSADVLPDVLDEALAEAKASGKFDGKDGMSCAHNWDGTILTITSASGSSSVDLKGDKGDKGDDGYTPKRGTDYFTADEVAAIVESAVNQTLKVIAPYSIGFNQGKLFAPATSASYNVTSVSDNSITFTYRGGSGVEEIIFPITGLFAGRMYTLVFDETYNGGFIGDNYRYGCGVIQKSTYDSTKYPTSLSQPSYIQWHTGSTGKQSGAITFTAQADTVYWIWNLGRIQDSVNHTITMNAHII